MANLNSWSYETIPAAPTEGEQLGNLVKELGLSHAEACIVLRNYADFAQELNLRPQENGHITHETYVSLITKIHASFKG